MAEPRSSPSRVWRRVGGVRARTTLAAVAVVGVALAAGGAALVLVMRDVLVDDARAGIEVRAREVAASLEGGETPPLAVGVVDEQLIQVVDGGEVVGSSRNVAGMPPVADLRPGGVERVRTAIDDDEFLAVARSATVDGRQLVVVVAQSIEHVAESTQLVTRLLLVGLPALLALVALTTWRVAGRALAPVEAMRSEAEGISASELHRRVPEPAAEDEVGRLARTMNRMLGRLEAAQVRQRRFVADASHELRSPLASIRQSAEVALAHPDRTTTAALAGVVLEEGLRMQRLVDDLLLLARSADGRLSLRQDVVDLDDAVLEEVRRLRQTGALSIDAGRVSGAQVMGDRVALGRVLRNLVDNAARHARSRITLELRESDGAVVLVVEDDGPGIPEADRARVVERFVRLDDARARDAGGAGLGLAIVDEVVRAHGGTFTISSGSLGGARVVVRLPSRDRP